MIVARIFPPALLLPLALFGAGLPAKEAPILRVESKASKVSFLAVGKPSMLKIHGSSPAGPSGELKLEGTQLRGTVEMDLESFDTGIELRNRHMKEKYLQVKEHPKARLLLLDAAVDDGFSKSFTSSGERPFKGRLHLHGRDQEVGGVFTATNGRVVAKFPIRLGEFGIDIPAYLGITVAELVEVSVELLLGK